METHFDALESEHERVDRAKLVADLKVVMHDLEEMMKSTAGDMSDKAKELRARLTASLANAKAACGRLEEKAIAGAKVADKVIRDHPYESIGIAFGVGLLIGVLVTRK
ncbi:MAG: DUF883 domain-containing protein [Verrucomicrobia bacterium]|nr:DUF883 domain-containing protein [Verrucomicrobiota bacterium]